MFPDVLTHQGRVLLAGQQSRSPCWLAHGLPAKPDRSHFPGDSALALVTAWAALMPGWLHLNKTAKLTKLGKILPFKTGGVRWPMQTNSQFSKVNVVFIQLFVIEMCPLIL